jgi:uncharacterized integral membrane protein
MTRRLTAAIVYVLLALVCAGFVRLNPASVDLDLYYAVVRSSAGVALVAAFIVGFAAGLAGAIGWGLRLVRERLRLERALKLAEAELRLLRATAPSHAR